MASVLAAAPAQAQAPSGAAAGAGSKPGEGAAEIVVTAQRRAERSRDVPISVTTLNQQQLAVANVSQLSDTVKLTPALRFDAQGSFVQPSIRGVGTAVTTSGGGPNVGIYVDGFFQSNAETADFQLLNVQNVQVLKGPQGTLFGRNTTGGAILVTTADPSTTPSAQARFTYGSFNAVTAQAYATYGLTDKIAMDVEGLYRTGDGFNTNLINGDDKVGHYHNWTVRTGLKAQLSDKVSLLLRYTHSNTDDPSPLLTNAFVDQGGGAGFFDKVSAAGQAIYGRSNSAGQPLIYYYAPAGTYTSTPGAVTNTDHILFTSHSDIIQATVKADLGFADMTSYTQYRRDKSLNHEDLDSTALQLFYLSIGVRDTTFSQEFLLNSKSGSRLQWTAGLNYYQNRDLWDIMSSYFGLPFSPFGGSGTTTKSIAAFADATYALTGRLFLTAGLRYSHDIVTDAYFETSSTGSYTAANGQTVSTASLPLGTVIGVPNLVNNRVTPRVVLRFKPDTYSSVYASFTRGYKAGILNVGGLSAVPVKPEQIDAYEVGYKYGRQALSVDLAGYYYNYRNLQVSSYQNGTADITNAATAEIYGLEAQFSYSLNSHLSVYGGGAWTHARYKSFQNAPYYSYCDPVATSGNMVCGAYGPGSITQTVTNDSGRRMQRAPDFTANIGASYGFDLARGRFTLSGNYYYTSAFYFDPSQQFRQSGYGILSLRGQWVDPSKRLTVAVFGDNVTDERYISQVVFNTLGIGGVWSAPSTWGVSLGFKI